MPIVTINTNAISRYNGVEFGNTPVLCSVRGRAGTPRSEKFDPGADQTGDELRNDQPGQPSRNGVHRSSQALGGPRGSAEGDGARTNEPPRGGSARRARCSQVATRSSRPPFPRPPDINPGTRPVFAEPQRPVVALFARRHVFARTSRRQRRARSGPFECSAGPDFLGLRDYLGSPAGSGDRLPDIGIGCRRGGHGPDRTPRPPPPRVRCVLLAPPRAAGLGRDAERN